MDNYIVVIHGFMFGYNCLALVAADAGSAKEVVTDVILICSSAVTGWMLEIARRVEQVLNRVEELRTSSRLLRRSKKVAVGSDDRGSLLKVAYIVIAADTALLITCTA